LGGRDVAARITQDWYEGMSSATEKVMEAANAPDASTTTRSTASSPASPPRPRSSSAPESGPETA
ncbi:MAG TPA: hypothetical protein VM408_03305, partial [Methylomirabilota bacterium]|nr:hypothetical protein [Methylomirabilota bacterium]